MLSSIVGCIVPGPRIVALIGTTSDRESNHCACAAYSAEFRPAGCSAEVLQFPPNAPFLSSPTPLLQPPECVDSDSAGIARVAEVMGRDEPRSTPPLASGVPHDVLCMHSRQAHEAVHTQLAQVWRPLACMAFSRKRMRAVSSAREAGPEGSAAVAEDACNSSASRPSRKASITAGWT